MYKRVSILFLVLIISQNVFGQIFTKLWPPAPFEFGQGFHGASVDIDNDGDFDFFNINNEPGCKGTLYLNDGQAGFEIHSNLDLTGLCNGPLKFKDLNLDGTLDLIIADLDLNSGVFLNDGYGNFTSLYNDIDFEHVYKHGLEIADFNGDDYPDIVLGRSTTNGNVIDFYLNNKGHEFILVQDSFFISVDNPHILSGDVNNDGTLDILISGHTEPPTPSIKMYLNDGSGNFIENTPEEFDKLFVMDIEMFDVEGDGDLDILQSGWSPVNERGIRLYLNDGVGNFTKHSSQEYSDKMLWELTPIDWDNDGDMDFIGTGDSAIEGAIYLYRNNTGLDFIQLTEINFPSELYFSTFITADFNGDLYQDIFMNGYSESFDFFSRVYLNNAISTSLVEENKTSTSNVTVNPNPISGETYNVTLSKDFIGICNFKLLDSNGKVYTQEKRNKTKETQSFYFYARSLTTGVYFINIQCPTKITIKKIIID